jgi:UDP-hydrolysing UDP-N-acetyl-D-glucosamine 2-epimerase
MKKIQNAPELDLILFVGASALLDKYGEVVELVKQDGFQVNEHIYMLIEGDKPATMAKSSGLGLIEMSSLLHKHKPDLTLIIGDRHEMISMAIASAFMNIPVAHTMGGEITGTIDESIRHAITKLSHIHFPANEQAKQNIIRMGEKAENVFNVGCPRIDTIKEILNENHDYEINKYLKFEGVGDDFIMNGGDFLLVSQHPVTSEYGSGETQIFETIHALKEIQERENLPVIMLWPNADAGTDDISRGIRKFREHENPQMFRFIKNLPLPIYVHLMKKTKCLVGNSSSGIREGAFIGTPVVNIGSRQKGRDKCKNVLDVDYDKNKIIDAILRQIKNGNYEESHIYGDGNASEKIVKILKEINVSPQKRLDY